MDILGEYGTILLILAILFGFFMAWGIGANDVANAMGTSVGSGALTIKQAILVAAIFEFSGAFLAGGQVTSTVRSGIVDPVLLAETPELLIYGMLAAQTLGMEPDKSLHPGAGRSLRRIQLLVLSLVLLLWALV